MSNKMLGAEAREANKAWLMQQVNVVMEPLMLSILNDKPSNTVSITCSLLQKVGASLLVLS